MLEIPEQFCTPFRASANRPHLILGCEPTALMMAAVLSIIIVFSAPNRYGIPFSVLLFIALRHLLRYMASEDPILISVHHESQRYNKGFWTARRVRPHRWRAR